MPVRLRNVSGTDRDMNGRTYEVDEVMEVKGGLRKNQPDDGHLIGTGDDARVYPAEHWGLVDGDEEDDPADQSDNAENKEND